MHQSYLTIMKEREKVIEQLHNQIKRLGEAKILQEGANASFGHLSSYKHMKQMSAPDNLLQDVGRMTP